MSRVITGILLLFLIQTFSYPIIYDKELNSYDVTTFQTNELDCMNSNTTPILEIHVDNQLGNDNFSGTAECPFYSVVEALKVSENGDTIIIHEGVYYEDVIIDNFENITIRVAENERVVFDGTESITQDLNGTWSLSTNNIHEVQINKNGWQIFVDYQEQIPARWPNANFSDFSVFDQTNNWAKGSIDEGGSYSNGELQDTGKLNTSGINPVGAIAILNVGSFKTWSRTIFDYNQSTNTFSYDLVPNWKPKHHYYFLEGKRELIDIPGEWWFDNSEKKLHMKFENGTDPNNIDVRIKTQPFAFNITNSNNISIEGLEFFATTFRTEDCNGCVIRDSDLIYPSTSKRGLGIAGEDVEERWVSRMDSCTNCLIDNSSFAYTDGSALEFHGAALKSHNNTVNNSHFEFIDWSSSDLVGLMVTVYDGGRDNTFSNNTIHNTGASSTLSIGDSPKIYFNNISNTGFIQSDGAVVQMMMLEQEGAEIAFNWIHNTEKYGIRMDGPAGGTNIGRNASIHHNVLWDIKTGIMAKGDYHNVSYNTVFGGGLELGKNDIIILFENGEGNENSSTNNNAADKIAAHRSKSYQEHPVQGSFIDNYNGYLELSGEVEDLLVDPENYDFRPISNSKLDNLSAGAYDALDQNPWEAGAEREWTKIKSLYIGCTNILAKNYDDSAGINNHNCDFEPESEPESELESEQNIIHTFIGTSGKEYAIWNHSPNNMTISQEYNEFKNEYQLLTLPAPKLSDTIFDGIELSYLGEIMQEYTPPQNQQPDLRKRLYFQNIESENLALADVTGSIVYRLEDYNLFTDSGSNSETDVQRFYVIQLSTKNESQPELEPEPEPELSTDNETEEDSKTEQFIEFHNETDDLKDYNEGQSDEEDDAPRDDKSDTKEFVKEIILIICCSLCMSFPFLLGPAHPFSLKKKLSNKVEIPPKSIIIENKHDEK